MFPVASAGLVMHRVRSKSTQTAGQIWDDSSFEVAVLGGISLVDWKLSKSTLRVIMRRFGSVHRFL